MGYDLHLTRKEYWADEDGPRIELEEWRAYVDRDPDIAPDADNPGPGHFVLACHPERWPLWWGDSGEVTAKSPDDVVIRKLVEVARALDARVLGDDDEIYGIDPSDATVFRRR